MTVYLMRHGIAIERDDPRCPADPERPLTDRGRKLTRQAAHGLRRVGVQPRRVMTSPYRRARETAEIAALVLASIKPEEHQGLVPGSDPAKFLTHIARGKGDCLVVGHAPLIDDLLALCLGSGRSISALKKAGVACVELGAEERGGGTLHWLMTPLALRRLGQGKD